MITQRFVALYGTIGIVVMIALLALLYFKLVPTSLEIPFFIIAILLFVGRVILRIALARQEKRAKSAGAGEPTSDPPANP